MAKQSEKPQKRTKSLVSEFLESECKESTMTKNSTRLELARAQNKKEREHASLRKCKERAKKAMDNMREQEAAFIPKNATNRS